MSQIITPPETDFVDRRTYEGVDSAPVRERRQFTNTHDGLSADAQELAQAIDEYKLRHRRRFITYEEMMQVIQSLGYAKGRFIGFGFRLVDRPTRRGTTVRLTGSNEASQPSGLSC